MDKNITKSLRAHVESHYPVLYLSTYEEAEADALILELSDGRKIMEWNMARGMVEFGNKQPLAAHCDLAAALENYLDQDLNNHFIVIRDAHLGLREQPLAVARLKALVNKILADDEASVTIFLISHLAYIPPEVEKFVTLFEMPYPDEAAIRAKILQYVEAYGFEWKEEEHGKLALAFQGLTHYEIGQLINRGYQQDGNIGLEDMHLVHDEKKQIQNDFIGPINTTVERTGLPGLPDDQHLDT